MKIKFFLLIIITTFLLSGCTISYLDPYTKSKYGEESIDNWFNDKKLGKLRRKAEDIDKIVSRKCTYIENKKNKYVFECTLTITEQGETVIPLSKHIKKKVYVVFIKEKGNKYSSKVYNSKYVKEKRKVWKEDKYLDY